MLGPDRRPTATLGDLGNGRNADHRQCKPILAKWRSGHQQRVSGQVMDPDLSGSTTGPHSGQQSTHGISALGIKAFAPGTRSASTGDHRQ